MTQYVLLVCFLLALSYFFWLGISTEWVLASKTLRLLLLYMDTYEYAPLTLAEHYSEQTCLNRYAESDAFMYSCVPFHTNCEG